MALAASKKYDEIGRKIESLKAEQLKYKSKIAQELAHEFMRVIQNSNALSIDPSILIGGFLEVIDTAQKNSSKSEVWQVMGQKFLKSQPKKNKSKAEGTKTKSNTN